MRKRVLLSGLAFLIILGVSLVLIVPRVRSGSSTEKWSFQVGSEQKGGVVQASPVVANGMVYVALNDVLASTSTVYAVDARSGREKWSLQTEGFMGHAPIVANGILYIASDDLIDAENSTLYALDARSGHKQWSLQTGGNFPSLPTVVNDTVYLSSNNTVYALDARTGNRRWIEQMGVLAGASPIVANGLVYIASAMNVTSTRDTISALEAASGQTKWSYQTEAPIMAPFAMVNNTVYVETHDNAGTLYALDALTGHPLWSFSIGVLVINIAPIVSDGLIYVCDDSGELRALNALTGHQSWSFWTNTLFSAYPTIANNLVYIAESHGRVYALNTVGHIKWSQQIDYAAGSFDFPPPTVVVVHGIVYGNTSDGELYALNAQSGRQQWSYQTHGYASVTPTVVNHVAYMMGGDTLDALQLPQTAF